MKKRTITWIVVSASAVVILLFLIFMNLLKTLTNPVDYNYGTETYPYFIQQYDGKIGVFKNDSKTPIQVVELPPSLLPPYDQSELEAGIPVRSEEELQKILEDYTS
ncbi:MAG: hypothetical protein RR977_01960 [Oscillospiraceae bacterium]